MVESIFRHLELTDGGGDGWTDILVANAASLCWVAKNLRLWHIEVVLCLSNNITATTNSITAKSGIIVLGFSQTAWV